MTREWKEKPFRGCVAPGQLQKKEARNFHMKNQPLRNRSFSAFGDTHFLAAAEISQCCCSNWKQNTDIMDNLYPGATVPKVNIPLDNLFLKADLLERYNNNSVGRLGTGMSAAIYQMTAHFFWALREAFVTQKAELQWTWIHWIEWYNIKNYLSFSLE